MKLGQQIISRYNLGTEVNQKHSEGSLTRGRRFISFVRSPFLSRAVRFVFACTQCIQFTRNTEAICVHASLFFILQTTVHILI
jgi:hypothetical protein